MIGAGVDEHFVLFGVFPPYDGQQAGRGVASDQGIAGGFFGRGRLPVGWSGVVLFRMRVGRVHGGRIRRKERERQMVPVWRVHILQSLQRARRHKTADGLPGRSGSFREEFSCISPGVMAYTMPVVPPETSLHNTGFREGAFFEMQGVVEEREEQAQDYEKIRIHAGWVADVHVCGLCFGASGRDSAANGLAEQQLLYGSHLDGVDE